MLEDRLDAFEKSLETITNKLIEIARRENVILLADEKLRIENSVLKSENNSLRISVKMYENIEHNRYKRRNFIYRMKKIFSMNNV